MLRGMPHDERIMRVARSLSDRHRLVLILHYAERLSIPQIASVLGTKEEDVALALAEIRFRFQSFVDRGAP